MGIKRYEFIIYPLLFAFCIAWAVSGWLDYRTSGTSAPSARKISGVQRQVTKLPDTSMIITKNIFKAEVSAGQIDEMMANVQMTAADSGFDGRLLGVLVGDEQSMAVISYKDKKYILRLDQEQDGLTLDDVGLFHAVVSKGAERYRLILKDDKDEKKSSPLKMNQNTSTTQKVKIPRSVVVKELSDVNRVIKSVLIIPYERNGKFEGYRVRRMTNTSVFRKIGVEKNDIIMRLNGKTLESPSVFFDALKNAENLSAVTLDILRRGNKMTLYVEIEG